MASLTPTVERLHQTTIFRGISVLSCLIDLYDGQWSFLKFEITRVSFWELREWQHISCWGPLYWVLFNIVSFLSISGTNLLCFCHLTWIISFSRLLLFVCWCNQTTTPANQDSSSKRQRAPHDFDWCCRLYSRLLGHVLCLLSWQFPLMSLFIGFTYPSCLVWRYSAWHHTMRTIGHH